jgi:MoxR-like ATPase
MRFQGTDSYVATDDLLAAVNAAIRLERPLLVKGEPGTGKTVLAEEIAASLGKPLRTWHVKSTTKAWHGLYEYDAVARLRDGQLGEERARDVRNYIVRGPVWEAFDEEGGAVLLIDEIDKADVEFPNDLLLELDRMEFFVRETKETIRARTRPVVVITSNNEKELPDAFLRRCFFHFIRFPDRETMKRIVDVHFPGLQESLLREALSLFYGLREVQGLKKRPSTSEFLDWIRLLVHEGVPPETIARAEEGTPPLVGALLKNEQDTALLRHAGLRRSRRV